MQYRSIPLLVVLTACGDLASVWSGTAREDAIVNGTRVPQNTFLTEGEIMALGFLGDGDGDEFCSGTLIRPRVVVTARHCVQGRNAANTFFGFGEQPAENELLAPVVEIHANPDIDFAMLILGVDATLLVTPLTPIDINRDPMGTHWRNRWVDAAGFGDTYSSATGRFFASVQIVGWDDETVHVYGHEEQGICYGDSGGPILYQPDADTPPVVVGTEQWGDSSCVGNDYLTRLDVVAGFVDHILAEPLPPPLEACGTVDLLGECRDGDVYWCNNGFLQSEECGALACGWLGDTWGYDCLPEECGELDFRGDCTGTTLTWCSHRDGLLSRDCADNGQGCLWIDETIGHDCASCPMCGGSECIDLQTSTSHCGACGTTCAAQHATGECVAGVCQIASCRDGWQDKDGEAGNGCEKKEGCAATPPTPWTALLLLPWLLRRRKAADNWVPSHHAVPQEDEKQL